jgi:transcription initiation factor IIE alpha subunit
MSDLTVKAEALISAVARAFYEDDAICLIDVLLRDKYLRDDDMGPRLSLQPKQLRRVLQFLQDEHIVKFEEVDDLAQGGSQQTKFWYIDYNQAVHTIRLRLFLLKQKLEKAELAARTSSYYLCPGYNTKRCNGRYTEEQAQTVVDPSSGLFLCQECADAYESSANPPLVSTYTLQLVDNAKDLKDAVDNMRRVHVQLSGKMIGSSQLRPSIYDLMQKARVKGNTLTSNLPSENFSLGIGSKRLAGTGRTAGIKAKKRAQLHATAAVVMPNKRLDDSVVFLKNAIGQEIRLVVEKGGGARAQLLATNRRRKRKLMDAAASRVGASLPVHWQLRVIAAAAAKKKQADDDAKRLEAEENGDGNKEDDDDTDKKDGSKNKKEDAPKSTKELHFLTDNIGRPKRKRVEMKDQPDEAGSDDEDELYYMNEEEGIVLVDDTRELLGMTDDERRAAFQVQYKMEMGRQAKLFQLEPDGLKAGGPPGLKEEKVAWEEG